MTTPKDEHFYSENGIDSDTKDVYEETGQEMNVGRGDECAMKIACKICGAITFEVGQMAYYTAIRCVVCKWEICIHSG